MWSIETRDTRHAKGYRIIFLLYFIYLPTTQLTISTTLSPYWPANTIEGDI